MLRCKSTGRIAFALLALAAVAAAQAPNPAGGFFLTSPLRLTAGKEHKKLVGLGGDSISDFLLLEQQFSIIKLAPRSEFAINYTPEFEIYSENRRFNSWNHFGGVRLVHLINPRLKLEIGDTFVSTGDPSRRFGGSVFLLPRSRYTENAAFVSFDYRYSPLTTLTFRTDNTFSKYRIPEGFIDPERAGLLDQMGTAFTAGATRQVTLRGKLTGKYSYLLTRPIGENVAAGGANYHQVGGSYKYTIGESLTADVGAGVILGTGTQWLLSGQIEKQIRTLYLSAGYSRQLAFYPTPQPVGGLPLVETPTAKGLLPNALYDIVSFGVRGKLTRRFGTQADVNLSRSNQVLENALGVSDGMRSVSGRLRLDYALLDRLIVFAMGEYYDQNLSEMLRVPVNRKRYSVGLDIVLSPAPNPIVFHRRRQGSDRDEDDAEIFGTNSKGPTDATDRR